MVKSEDSWIFHKHSDWDSPNLNHMNRLLPPSQQSIALSCMNPFTLSANVAFQRFSVPGLPVLETGQANVANGLSYCLPPLIESSISPLNPYIKEPQYAFPRRLGIKITPDDVTSSNHKRFLIFDQSGHHTRFFLSSFGSSSQNPFIATLKTVHACHSRDVEQVPLAERMSPTKPTIQGESDQIIGEGNEYHEDTEEINALLHSDDDEYEYDYDDGEDGEVTSTDRSPLSIKVSLENNEQVGGITEEVATSNDSTKRQRLLDGGYKKSLVVDAASSEKFDRSYEYDNDAESCCSRAKTEGKVMAFNLGTKRLRTEKIHETLKILEDIIPGLKSKEPLLIIDEAINYLKSLKIKARDLGLSY